ncbi:DUF58 domain-containing protein [Oceanobacillus manasiensis]|uniref:DUF58 domain-containing protein n=1 Tax=Oceanobacillus manasiensis TaxID=586413 RepID=UPI0005AA7DE8|nr:DUF58 domain-containing protein [Oceanobacillus manasiensis]
MKENLKFVGNFAFIIFLLVSLFAYAMFQGGFVSWFLFYSFLPLGIYHISLLLYPMRNWKVSRKLSRHVIQAGDGIDVTIHVKRTIPFPLYFCVCEEVFPDSLHRIDSRKEKYRFMKNPEKLFKKREIKRIVFPYFKKEFELTYSMKQIPRGEHQLNDIRIRTGDVFGMVKKDFVFTVEDQLIAYPNARPVKLDKQLSSFGQGSVSSTQSLQLKNTNVATGIREYMPGDKFSWIDWKQTAKKNTMITKEFEQEKSTEILLVLDSCSYEDGNHVTYEATLELTISLMHELQKQGSEVGLLTIGEESVHVPVHNEPKKKELVRQHLTRLQPGGVKPFSLKLKEELIKLDSGNIVMLITSNIDQGFNDMTKKLKQRMKRIVILYVPTYGNISETERIALERYRFEGVSFCLLTEAEFLTNPLEVSNI